MSRIRVLRLLEYTYDTVETMEADRKRWHVQEGRLVNPRITIRSTTLPLEVLDDEPEPVDEPELIKCTCGIVAFPPYPPASAHAEDCPVRKLVGL